MTCTPLFSSVPSNVFIRSKSAKLECEQHEGRLVLFNACSFVAGGPEPQEGGELGQASIGNSIAVRAHTKLEL